MLHVDSGGNLLRTVVVDLLLIADLYTNPPTHHQPPQQPLGNICGTGAFMVDLRLMHALLLLTVRLLPVAYLPQVNASLSKRSPLLLHPHCSCMLSGDGSPDLQTPPR